ncbi:MAG TPA: amidohydrolase, partial [Pseudomonas sp.]|nr:amidohydrolase [Pseudomonas sp.]
HQEKLDFLLSTLERMLGDYPNLYIDLSWTVLQPYLLDAEGRPDPRWVRLVSRYPERFMLGSDVVGRFEGLGDYLQAFRPFLDALPEDVAHKVARDNFLAVLPRKRQAELRD